MTITNNTIRTSTNGDGVTTAFAVSFPFYEQTELVVILVQADGTEVTQILTTHYTVSGGDGTTGTITMVTAPASGERLVRYRVSPLTQETDYADGDAFPADSHEAALDRLTMQNQEQADKLARALTLSESSEVASSLTMEEPVAGRGLKWNATEDGIINTGVDVEILESNVAADAAQTTLDRMATAADVVSTNADVVLTNADVVSSAANAALASEIASSADAISGLSDVDTVSSAPLTDDALIWNGVNWVPGSSTAEIGFLNKSAWADDGVETITLTTPASAIGKAHVKVWEEIPDTGSTNSEWDIITDETGFTIYDSAYAVSLTPAATSGTSVSFTLGSGSWASTDVGKIIKNVSTGEAGQARIMSIASAVAICEITTTFTDTNAIASGDWELNAGAFTNGAFELAGASGALTGNSETVINAATSNYIDVGVIDSTKAIAVFRDGGVSNYGRAVVLTISGTTITANTEYTYNASVTESTFVTVLSATKAIVFNRTTGAPYDFTGRVCTISGTALSFGSSLSISGGVNGGYYGCQRISDTTAFVNWGGYSPSANKAGILTVSGTTLTVGTATTYEAALEGATYEVALLSSTLAFVAYATGGAGYARTMTISGTTVTANTRLPSQNRLLQPTPAVNTLRRSVPTTA